RCTLSASSSRSHSLPFAPLSAGRARVRMRLVLTRKARSASVSTQPTTVPLRSSCCWATLPRPTRSSAGSVTSSLMPWLKRWSSLTWPVLPSVMSST
ncbi:hypothetical protein BGX26_008882, partial [Mortierella sp. AD094]